MRSSDSLKGAGEERTLYTSPEEELLAAKKKALSLLEYSDRTEYELRQKLSEKGFSGEAAEQAVEYAKSFHYLDDRRYAENFIRTRSSRKSVREMKMLLSGKGISEAVLQEVLEAEPPEEAETVKELYLKKYGRSESSDPDTMNRAVRYFAGKGFSFEAIRSGILRALEGQD